MTIVPSTRRGRPAFIVNPNAGRFRRQPALLDALRKVAENRADLFVTHDAAALDEAARIVMRQNPEVVALFGGDGSYVAGVTALRDASDGAALPPVAFARCGTVSILARNWKSHPDPIGTALRAVGPAAAWHVTRRPTIEVTEAGGASRVGFTFGTGLVARFFEEYERDGSRGNAAAVAIVARLLLDVARGGELAKRVLSPLPCRLAVDGSLERPEAYSLILATVLRDVGLHHLVAYRAGEDPERPHLVASCLSPRGLALAWPRVVLGKPFDGPGHVDRLASSIEVTFAGNGSYVLDGDTFHAQRVTIGAGPRLRVVT